MAKTETKDARLAFALDNAVDSYRALLSRVYAKDVVVLFCFLVSAALSAGMSNEPTVNLPVLDVRTGRGIAAQAMLIAGVLLYAIRTLEFVHSRALSLKIKRLYQERFHEPPDTWYIVPPGYLGILNRLRSAGPIGHVLFVIYTMVYGGAFICALLLQARLAIVGKDTLGLVVPAVAFLLLMGCSVIELVLTRNRTVQMVERIENSQNTSWY